MLHVVISYPCSVRRQLPDVSGNVGPKRPVARVRSLQHSVGPNPFCVPDLDAHRQAGDSLSLYFPRNLGLKLEPFKKLREEREGLELPDLGPLQDLIE